MNRRRFGTALAGSIAATLLPDPARGCRASLLPAPGAPGLRVRAARRGLSFGCAIHPSQVATPSPFTQAALREADTVLAADELKWGEAEKTRGAPDYGRVEMLARFAAQHGLALRGHAAFWYHNLPDWVRPVLTGPDATAAALARVTDVVGHFRGRIAEWDVVNEAVQPKDGQPDRLRLAPFGRPMGAGWIADCFHAAHQADPAARLYLNDFAVETDWPEDEARRRGVLDLLTELKRRGAPVHGFGSQSHLAVGRRFTPAVYRRFLAEVAALGLEIRITELDCGDYKSTAPVPERDQQVADYVLRYLDTALDERAVRGVITWGLSDRDSWLRHATWAGHDDGTLTRPLPLDDDLNRKPMWEAIGRAFDGAPSRA